MSVKCGLCGAAAVGVEQLCVDCAEDYVEAIRDSTQAKSPDWGDCEECEERPAIVETLDALLCDKCAAIYYAEVE